MTNPMELWKTNRNPLRELVHWQRAMDRALEDYTPTSNATTSVAFNPTCEVSEDKTQYYFKFDLPGLSKDQVKVEVHENQLTVSGERRDEKKEEGKKYHFSELAYGSFLRTFTLPLTIDNEKVEAKFENGVLTVGIAKTETAKSRQINIR